MQAPQLAASTDEAPRGMLGPLACRRAGLTHTQTHTHHPPHPLPGCQRMSSVRSRLRCSSGPEVPAPEETRGAPSCVGIPEAAHQLQLCRRPRCAAPPGQLRLAGCSAACRQQSRAQEGAAQGGARPAPRPGGCPWGPTVEHHPLQLLLRCALGRQEPGHVRVRDGRLCRAAAHADGPGSASNERKIGRCGARGSARTGHEWRAWQAAGERAAKRKRCTVPLLCR